MANHVHYLIKIRVKDQGLILTTLCPDRWLTHYDTSSFISLYYFYKKAFHIFYDINVVPY